MILELAALATLLAGTTSPNQPKPNVVIVTARDFSLEIPASIPAGVTTFKLVNKGKLAHHVMIVRLDAGRSAAEALKVVMSVGRAPRPEWMHPVGGPQAVTPGIEGNATLILEPGNYLAFCEVPGPDTTAHYMRGMAKAFTVTGPPRAGTLPAADVALSLTEYDFAFTTPLTRGRHVVAVTNRGSQAHMVVLTRFPPGKGTADFLAWAKNPQGRPGPGTTMGGVTEIPPGATVTFTRNFIPGHYGMICFTPDAKDGKPHFMHGMQKEFEVR
ncbi:MAG TPA: hypothetical protein VG432_01505 [Gemmatimonadaceae bacterium]|nr:hypothetical protein [Gemmatimonadaceae bacterium]